MSGTIHDPWEHGPTATSGPLTAYLTGTETVRARTALEDGGVRWTRSTTSFDTTYGMPIQVDDSGDESTTDDDVCVRYAYARNTSTWLVDRVASVETVSVDCGTSPAYPDDVLSHTRTFFDDPDTWAAAPTRGLPVKIRVVDSWDGQSPVWLTTARNSFDVHGRVVEAADALDRKASTTYTPASGGPVTGVSGTNPLGHSASSVLEPAWGAAVQATDANGRVSELSYDGLGRLTAVWLPGRNAATETPNMEFEYLVRKEAPSAVTTRQLLPSGSDYYTSITLFDGLLRPRQAQVQAAGGGRVITDTIYDSRGLEEWVSKPFYDTSNDPPTTTLVAAGAVPQIPGAVEYLYDGVGRITDKVIKANGAEAWRTTYVYGGDRVHVTPPDGDTATTTIQDARGQTVALRQYHDPTPTGAYDETTYAYTGRGELASVTDSAGNTWSYEYDQRGRQVSAEDPDAGIATRSYDAVGQLLSMTDGRGVTLGFTYDDLGRQTSTRDGSPTGAVRAQWVYDTLPGGLGLITRSIRHETGAQYVNEVLGYDAAGRPTGTRTTVPPAETGLAGSYDTTVTYSPDGSIASATLPAAGDLGVEQLIYLYNDVGQQTEIGSAQSVYVWEANYNKLGELTRRTLGNYGKRTAVNYTYDEPTGRLMGIDATPELKPEVLDLSYEYDDAGNLLRVADSPGSATPNDTQCFRYDHLRRVTDAWTPLYTTEDNCDTYPGPLGGVAPYRLVWGYDEAGNRLSQSRYGPGGGTSTYTYPPAGQPQPHTLSQVQTTSAAGIQTDTYSYDAGGNTIERTVDGVTQTLTWDAEGQIESITDPAGTTEFVYDADGGRLIRRDPDGAATLYLDGQEVRYNPATGTTTCTRYYSHGGTPIAVRTATDLTWLVTDHHSTATVAIRDSDMQAQRRRSLPFGEDRGAEPVWWAGDKGFLGGTEDPTGLTHLGARLYDPNIGRFVSVDPIMNLADPQQMHGYAYANSNPLTWSDPSGLLPCGAYPGAAQQACNAAGSSASSSSPSYCGAYPAGMQQACDRARTPKLSCGAYPAAMQQACDGARNRGASRGPVVTDRGVAKYGTEWIVYDDGTVVINGWVLPPGAPADVAPLAIELDELFYRQSDQIQPDDVYGAIEWLCISYVGYAGSPNCSREFGVNAWWWRLSRDIGEMGPAAYAPGGAFVTGVNGHNSLAGAGRYGRGCNSFPPNTLVLMADGSTKPIEDIEVGDVVLATDPETGVTSARPVVDTIVGIGDKTLVQVFVAADDAVPIVDAAVATDRPLWGTVTATDHHPFWSPDQGTWTHAADLQSGDRLHTPGNTNATVTAVAAYTDTLTVHNLTIANIHTYYVLAGDTPVLVHNTGPGGYGCGNPLPTQKKGPTQRLTNAQAADLAAYNGYRPTNQMLRGERIFTNGKQYIVQDTTSHIGGTWKIARSPSALNSKSSRTATTDALLNPIGG